MPCLFFKKGQCLKGDDGGVEGVEDLWKEVHGCFGKFTGLVTCWKDCLEYDFQIFRYYSYLLDDIGANMCVLCLRLTPYKKTGPQQDRVILEKGTGSWKGRNKLPGFKHYLFDVC